MNKQNIKIANTPLEQITGLKDDKYNAMYFPNANKMTMEGMKDPVIYYGITNGKITDKGMAYPGQKFNVNGVNTLEIRAAYNRPKAQNSGEYDKLVAEAQAAAAKDYNSPEYIAAMRKLNEASKIYGKAEIHPMDFYMQHGKGKVGYDDVKSAFPDKFKNHSDVQREFRAYLDANRDNYFLAGPNRGIDNIAGKTTRGFVQDSNRFKNWWDQYYRKGRYGADGHYIPGNQPANATTTNSGNTNPNTGSNPNPAPVIPVDPNVTTNNQNSNQDANANNNSANTQFSPYANNPGYLNVNLGSMPSGYQQQFGNKRPGFFKRLGQGLGYAFNPDGRKGRQYQENQGPMYQVNPNNQVGYSTYYGNNSGAFNNQGQQYMRNDQSENQYSANPSPSNYMDQSGQIQFNYGQNNPQQPRPLSRREQQRQEIENKRRGEIDETEMRRQNDHLIPDYRFERRINRQITKDLNRERKRDIRQQEKLNRMQKREENWQKRKDQDYATDQSVLKAEQEYRTLNSGQRSDVRTERALKNDQFSTNLRLGELQRQTEKSNATFPQRMERPSNLYEKKKNFHQGIGNFNIDLTPDQQRINYENQGVDFAYGGYIKKKVPTKLVAQNGLGMFGTKELIMDNDPDPSDMQSRMNQQNTSSGLFGNFNNRTNNIFGDYRNAPQSNNTNTGGSDLQSKMQYQSNMAGEVGNLKYRKNLFDLKPASTEVNTNQTSNNPAAFGKDPNFNSVPSNINYWGSQNGGQSVPYMDVFSKDANFNSIPSQVNYSTTKNNSKPNPNGNTKPGNNQKGSTLDRGAYYQLYGTFLPAVYNYAESMKKPETEKPIRNQFDGSVLNFKRSQRYNADYQPIISNTNAGLKSIREGTPNSQTARANQIATMNSANRLFREEAQNEFKSNQSLANDYYTAAHSIGAERANENRRVNENNLMHRVTRDNLRDKAISQFGVGINDYGKQLANRDMNEFSYSMLGQVYKNYGLASYNAVMNGEVELQDIIQFKGDIEAAKRAKAQRATGTQPVQPTVTTTNQPINTPGLSGNVQTQTTATTTPKVNQ